MSAAALTAHDIPSEPHSKQSRKLRDRIYAANIGGSLRYAQMRRFRSRCKYRLPCES